MALLFFVAKQKGCSFGRGQPFFSAGQVWVRSVRLVQAGRSGLMASSPNGIFATLPRRDEMQINIGRDK